ncbi:MAG: hypothetical protein Q4D04_12355, partial [Clostridia bacterium]|nr:hypothetical protein [Clostridia bacterium]
DIEIARRDRASILRWPIEQCFEECKGCFGMADYESRTYCAWERHMLFVMMAHFFTRRYKTHYALTRFVPKAQFFELIPKPAQSAINR